MQAWGPRASAVASADGAAPRNHEAPDNRPRAEGVQETT